MKLENTKKGYYILDKEVYLMNHLYGPRIPYVKSFGNCGFYNVLVMEVLGKSLEDIKQFLPQKKMSIPCVCKLSYQMLQILEHIHKKSFIHRDVKPDNFIMGIGQNAKFLYMIDFGFAKTYRDPNTLAHIPFQKGAGMTGTARFASINTLSGYTQSRRDDLESLGYVIVFIATGTLPWANVQNDDKKALYNRILEIKMQTTPEALCRGLPRQFEEYINYVRGMTFEQEPDYRYLRNLFLAVLQNLGEKMDFCYDWDNKINNANIIIDNNAKNNNNDERMNDGNNNFVPNNEKLYNDDNILKNNYNNQVKIAIQNNIYTLNEINESGIEPLPMDSNELNELNDFQNNNMNFHNGRGVPNRRSKEGNCECCIIM
jgi:serine/threonine protein kinase